MSEENKISIPPDVYGALEKIVAQSLQFDSVQALVAFLLREFLDPHDVNKDDSELILQRLRALGYLDE